MTNIILNWPDAIKCTGSFNSVFFLHAANGDGGYYRQIYSLEDRYVNFNSDGSFKNKGGDSGSDGCSGKSITQLYSLNQAFNLVSSSAQSSPEGNIVMNWPDAIKCTGSFNAVFFLHATNEDGGYYRQVYKLEDRYVNFYSDGSFKNKGGDSGSDGCSGKSITQLYSLNQAFNLVSSSAQSSPEGNIVMNWPDAIKCTGSFNAVFFLHATNVDGGYYRQVYKLEDR